MKDLSLVGIIIGAIVILSISIGEQVYMKNITKLMMSEIQQAETLVNYGREDEGLEIIQNIMRKWENQEKILEIMINHEDVNKISHELIKIRSKLENILTSNNISSNFAVLKEYIKNVEVSNEFTLSNVL